MAGMLYSLVALGFVLIYKASGVFNFAQGAMVLFAALAMARFAEWFPRWTGIENPIVGQRRRLPDRGRRDVRVAWLIERFVLRHLVNQEGTTLLMATLGITLPARRRRVRRSSAATSTRSTSACPRSRSWPSRACSRAAS
jgi:branched-chain amino acid transport system permease protein